MYKYIIEIQVEIANILKPSKLPPLTVDMTKLIIFIAIMFLSVIVKIIAEMLHDALHLYTRNNRILYVNRKDCLLNAVHNGSI